MGRSSRVTCRGCFSFSNPHVFVRQSYISCLLEHYNEKDGVLLGLAGLLFSEDLISKVQIKGRREKGNNDCNPQRTQSALFLG